MTRTTLKTLVRSLLETGLTREQAWHFAKAEGWYASWNYVRKIARDWERDKEHEGTDA